MWKIEERKQGLNITSNVIIASQFELNDIADMFSA